MHLSKGWKISLIGITIAIVGWSLWGVNLYWKLWFYGDIFYFTTVWLIGLIVMFIGSQTIRKEGGKSVLRMIKERLKK